MDSAIGEQIERFKAGDFSGYQEYYNDTVKTVYTMLHTIIPDAQLAQAQIPAAYDSMYRNVSDIEHTELFYEWMAKQVNDVSLRCLLETGAAQAGTELMEAVDEEGPEVADDIFYDYAMEDAALAITDRQAGDNEFASRLQKLTDDLEPMEKIVFQRYYYFGESVPEIVARTGLSHAAVKNILKKVRSGIISAISDTRSREDDKEQEKYSLRNVPWLWLMFQNRVSKDAGLPLVGLSEFAAGMTETGAGKTPDGMAGAGAGKTPDGMAGAGAGNAPGGGLKGAAHGTGRILGTLGGRIGVGIISAVIVAAIGAGVYHAITHNDAEEDRGSASGYDGALLPVTGNGDGYDQNEDISADYDQTEDEQTGYEEEPKSAFDSMIEEARASVDEYQRTGASYGEDYYMVTRYAKKDCLYTICDVNGDGEDELLFGCWNDESHKVELRNIIYKHTTVCFDGTTYYCGNEKIAEYGRNAEDYELVMYKHAMEYDEDSYLKILQDGTWRYYNMGYVEGIDTIEENDNGVEGGNYKNYDHDFFIRHINDDYYGQSYTEISEASWEEKQQEYSYNKLEWKPLFPEETILTDEPDIPDSDGRF